MATKKREFIDPNELMRYINEKHCFSGLPMAAHICTMELLTYAPRVNAVPVDEVKFLYWAIDKNGIPELKIQLGDKILCLRREGDPVDVREVVHGRWEEDGWEYVCSHCKTKFYDDVKFIIPGDFKLPRFCPECGAKMDGDGNGT
jgi:hypothetical protein